MEGIQSDKHRKRYRKEKSSNHRERTNAKNSSQKATTSVLACFSKTEKSYEKQIPRKQLTHGRITTRPGLFHQGKCTSFVHRALCFSPTKKARMDEDLHRIIQLANGMPDEATKYKHVLERPKSYEISANCCSGTESVDVCEDSSYVNENFHLRGMNESLVEHRDSRLFSKKMKHSTLPEHEKMVTDMKDGRSPEKKTVHTISSTSTSSSDSPSCSSSKYSSPSLKEYEDFAAAAILPLTSKKLLLFSGRDCLKEKRERIQTILHQNQIRKKSCCVNTSFAANQEEMSDMREDSLLNAPSRVSSVVAETATADVHISPSSKQCSVADFSPFPCILSPKTTIMNPLEYLKRVEQANRQKERTFFDSGHESGHSHGSSLSNSQNKIHSSNELLKSCDPYSLETNECFIPSQNVGDNLLYQHSNRSFIDSPQAFKVRDGSIQLPAIQCASTSSNPYHCQETLDDRLKHYRACQRIQSDFKTEHDIPGLRYLMDIAEIGNSSISLSNPCDLLDELDALDCDVAVDSGTASARDLRRQFTANKHRGPPPSPPTPEHKFYRRKMF